MISVEEAKQIVGREIPRGPQKESSLEEALGLVLAENIFSPIDSPSLNSSAMDGFAIRHEEACRASRSFPSYFRTVGFVAAGDLPEKKLEPGEAIKVMTGAMIPEGATAVIPQEDVLQDSQGTILVSREVEWGEDIRFQGEEIKAGGLALPKDTLLTEGAIAFLASLGISKGPVYAPPRIAILPTGSELVRNPSEITRGKILETNSIALRVALKNLRAYPEVYPPIADDKETLISTLESALKWNDLVLVLGGVSVGQFDLVKGALKELDVTPLFWQVAQKPGKPLYFGRRGSTFVFGLPGNPASSLVCFYEYVRAVILQWMGYQQTELAEDLAKITAPFRKKPGRTHFLRAIAKKKADGFWVSIPKGQESHRMSSFSQANCLAVIPQETGDLREGEEVSIHWLGSVTLPFWRREV